MKILCAAVFAAAMAVQAHGAEVSADTKSSPQPPVTHAAAETKAAPAAEKEPPAPISCFKAADELDSSDWGDKDLTAENKIRLCSGAAAADAPIACFKKAYTLERDGKVLAADDRLRLCSGAGAADAPIACFKAAEKLTGTEWSSLALTLDNMIELCGGAVSAEEPINCFKAAAKLTTTELGGKAVTADNKIKLCGKKPRL